MEVNSTMKFSYRGRILKHYDLRVHDIKLYKAQPVERQVATTPQGGDFQIIGYFAPIKSSLEKELYPLVIGTIAIPPYPTDKACFWRE